MSRRRISLAAASVGLVALIAFATVLPTSLAYNRYNDGCQSCHGTFAGSTSPKGSVFPNGNKHTMHRSTNYMNTKCGLCHRADDGNNPFTGSSDGTVTTVGVGCTGCHVAAGLRKHHQANAVTSCYSGGSGCHGVSDPTPPGENVPPPYYGTVDTRAANPCNGTAQNLVNENWTNDPATGPWEGADTDGDNLYDMADPDCSGVVATPGETATTTPMTVTAYDKALGTITIGYGVACQATDHNVEHGLLANLSAVNPYAGQVCAVGNTGSASFTLPDNSFFLIVGNASGKEGSYGTKSSGGTLTERPDDTTSVACPVPQDLVNRCDP